MRFRHQLLPANTIFWEPYAPISGQPAADLGIAGYYLANQGFNGDIQAVRVEHGVPERVSDPRGRGVTSIGKKPKAGRAIQVDWHRPRRA